jgi:hypothetical protein
VSDKYSDPPTPLSGPVRAATKNKTKKRGCSCRMYEVGYPTPCVHLPLIYLTRFRSTHAHLQAKFGCSHRFRLATSPQLLGDIRPCPLLPIPFFPAYHHASVYPCTYLTTRFPISNNILPGCPFQVLVTMASAASGLGRTLDLPTLILCMSSKIFPPRIVRHVRKDSLAH